MISFFTFTRLIRGEKGARGTRSARLSVVASPIFSVPGPARVTAAGGSDSDATKKKVRDANSKSGGAVFL
jgi:hypothetical protein